MIIFAHSKCKRYENRKIQGVALPKKERNGQEWKSSHHGTHHGEQDKKKGGRPPTGRVRKLSKSVTVKFSKPSYEALRLRARKANRKLAEYIRESALNGEVVSGHNAETVAIAKSRIYAGRTTKLSPSRTDSTNGRTYPRPLEWYFLPSACSLRLMPKLMSHSQRMNPPRRKRENVEKASAFDASYKPFKQQKKYERRTIGSHLWHS